ncbi:transposase [Cellulophaga sp. L1A9]|uniref:transposase n=1 Tax=Cellulophaga sp. L1A9 TaxID=2686362 RepID=UPI00131E39CB|nr:transposase [Cellulophaga sp. L1A9]
MKHIKNASNKAMTKTELDRFAEKRNNNYPYAVQSWQRNSGELRVYFDFPLDIRKIICTTNLIENINGKIRKTPKIKWHSQLMVPLKNQYGWHSCRLLKSGYFQLKIGG